ncbi:MAG: DUF2070 family protein, partial [Thaumarchaeota archaeon]|nr:DUF2070 family protein [Nitrososphaerota archaeon]
KPNGEETENIIKVASELIAELSSAKQQSFKVGFAHSSEIGSKLPNDVGPAGIGLLYFDLSNTSRFCFLVVDANNAKLGFREKILEEFLAKTEVRILEICTSDTHVTAARTFEAKGYLALGDRMSHEDFVSVLLLLFEKARSRSSVGQFSTLATISQVKTIGGEVMDDFSGLLDETSLIAKRGAAALALVAVVVTTLVAIV